MRIKYDLTELELKIEDKDKAEWLDGTELFYKLPKDDQPEFNPYEYFDGYATQPYYILDRFIRGKYPLNKVPKEIVEALENLEKLAEILDDYSNHVLGVCLKLNKG